MWDLSPSSRRITFGLLSLEYTLRNVPRDIHGTVLNWKILRLSNWCSTIHQISHHYPACKNEVLLFLWHIHIQSKSLYKLSKLLCDNHCKVKMLEKKYSTKHLNTIKSCIIKHTDIDKTKISVKYSYISLCKARGRTTQSSIQRSVFRVE